MQCFYPRDGNIKAAYVDRRERERNGRGESGMHPVRTHNAADFMWKLNTKWARLQGNRLKKTQLYALEYLRGV